MIKIASLRQIISLLVVAVFMSACENCEDPRRPPVPFTAELRGIVPGEVGDSILFRDGSGIQYYMVCNRKEIIEDGYGRLGGNNPCEDFWVSWERLTASFKGNLTSDNGVPLEFSAIISGGLNGGDISSYPNTNNCTRKPGKFFYLRLNSTTFYGFTNDQIIPKINNFNFRSILNLNGKLYPNINYSSITPNSETSCPSPVSSNSEIDSVYYSTQFGLIRLTAVGGKKYQRVL